MKREQFTDFLRSPEMLDQMSVTDLQDLLREFPYFHTAHLLLLKNLHNIESIRFDSQLKYSSAFVTNRRVLFNLLHSRQMEVTVEKQEEPSQEKKVPAVEIESRVEEPKEVMTSEPGVTAIQVTADDREDKMDQDQAVIPEKEVREEVEIPPLHEKESLEETIQKRMEEIRHIHSTEPASAEPKEPRQGESIADRVLREISETRTKQQAGKEEAAKDILPEEKPEVTETAPVSSVGPEPVSNDLLVIDESIQAEAASPGEPSSAEAIKDVPAIADLLELDQHADSQGADQYSPDVPLVLPPEKPEEQEKAEKKTGDTLNKEPAESGKHSFGQWFDYLGDPSAEAGVTKDTPLEQRDDLIDKFLQENPRISQRQKTESVEENDDLALDSISEKDDFFTDTLAKIYLRQGYYSKAIFAYEKLSLKYPEKSSYFASQIKKINDLINKKQG